MKLKKFLDNLNKLVKDHPEYLELDVISSKDSEGNGFEEVYYEPSVGVFDDEDFCPMGSDDFEEEYEYTDKDVNAICIN
jgi:hypothetical protein